MTVCVRRNVHVTYCILPGCAVLIVRYRRALYVTPCLVNLYTTRAVHRYTTWPVTHAMALDASAMMLTDPRAHWVRPRRFGLLPCSPPSNWDRNISEKLLTWFHCITLVTIYWWNLGSSDPYIPSVYGTARFGL